MSCFKAINGCQSASQTMQLTETIEHRCTYILSNAIGTLFKLEQLIDNTTFINFTFKTKAKKKTNKNRRSQHSQQECKDPRRHCFWCLVTLTFDLSTKINWFPGLMVKHFYVKFDDRSCIGFWDIVRKNARTNRQTPVKTTPASTAVGVGEYKIVNNAKSLKPGYPHIQNFEPWNFHTYSFSAIIRKFGTQDTTYDMLFHVTFHFDRRVLSPSHCLASKRQFDRI